MPVGPDAKSLPKSLCIVCLGTVFEDGTQCDHFGQKAWKKTYCEVGKCSYLLCDNCPKHMGGQTWFKNHHDHRAGFRNFLQIVKDLSEKVVNSYVGMLSIGSIMSTPLSEIMVSPSDRVRVYSSDMFPQIIVNGRPIGSTSIPTELIKIHHDDRCTSANLL